MYNKRIRAVGRQRKGDRKKWGREWRKRERDREGETEREGGEGKRERERGGE